MLVDFSDFPNTAPSISAASDAMLSVNSFYQSNSFGQMSMTAAVIGTFRMPTNSASYVSTFDISRLRNDAFAAARGSGYEPNNYDYDIVAFDNVGFSFAGWGTIGSRGVWLQGNPFSAQNAAHELGHNLGLWHANAWSSPSVIGSGSHVEQGNPFDAMGSAPPFPTGHFNLNFKFLLGWLPANYLHTVTSNNTYRIYAMDGGGALNSARRYGLHIPAGVTNAGAPADYWVECRQLINNSAVSNGVIVMWGSTNLTSESRLLDTTPGSQVGGSDMSDSPVTIGRSFTDPNKLITIAPIARGGTGADTYMDVQVTLNSTVIPPTISTQPVGQTVMAGSNATFNVIGSSSSTISYEWRRYGVPLTGATNFALLLTNVSASQGGDYSVILSNSLGSVVSSLATLTVTNLPPTNCYPMPSGLIAWWAAEENALDWVGTNHGVLQQSAGFGPGKVGQAFSLNGIGNYISIPDQPIWAFGTNAFTIELWANFFGVASGLGTVFLASDSGPGATNKWIFWLNDNQLRLHVNGNQLDNLGAAPFAPVFGNWYHLAVTRSGNTFQFYINGALVSTWGSAVTIPDANGPLTIGAAEGGGFFNGLIDDVRIYNRALSASEVLGIYNSGSTGMCPPANPPALLEFTTTAAFADRGAGHLSFIVSRIGNTYSTVTVNYASSNGTAIAGIDYTGLAGLLTFNPGETNKIIGVDLLNNPAAEETKQFSLNLFGASTNAVIGAKSAETVTIAGCLPSPAGLVAWWNADGQVNDLVGNNNGALHGGAAFVPGKVGQAISLNGVDGYIEIPNSETFNLGPTYPMSICLWVYRTSPNTAMHILGKRVGCNGSGVNYQLAYDGIYGSGLYFDGEDGGIYSGGVYSGKDLPMNTWVHLAVTFDGTTFGFYTNGLLVATGSGTLGPTNSVPLRIGASGDCAPFGGMLDEIQFFNRALSAAEIQSIYAADTNGLCLPKPLMFIAPLAYNKSNGFVANATLRNGQSYRIQANTNLQTSNWLTLTNFTGGTAPVFRFADSTATNFPQRFYRIVTP